ncbi:MAG: LacI family DNA-binding transcriptional regulator [Halioglobus sp.]
MKATIKDVAKLAGVSFKTVSRVINREPSVGEELKAKVWEAVEELNYQPNLSARQMRGGASFIAFIYDNPNSHYVIDMQHGILGECKKQGYELLIHPSDSRSDDVVEELERLASNSHIAGLVLTPPFSESEELIQSLLAKQVSFVRILSGSSGPDTLSPCVFVDDFQAAYDITDYLIRLGHRDIGFLGGEEAHRSSMERLKGYRAALMHHDIAVDDSLILPGDYNFESGTSRTEQLFQRQPRPTAIFACNDEIAAGALFAARINEVAVPQELSIAGFEDSPFSRQTWPKLTTAHQPNTSIAECAANMLIHAVREAKQAQNCEALPSSGFSPKLVARDSTGPAPQ